ncbi:LysM peptidoglycan-binding domain-containing protein [Hymenobacter metallilatus]|uniref:LysM peptidoglycan-binding domain-containing protein n=1 Tax=Hymenobacter metallilatus TaxID=2493666 RepID=A0A3R9LUW6_9BACT|nr:LysM peptidoglycan-binding domain-containing protein [Hymenobacter metallilatus]RSK24005.1 LysM peptidoglycan-binding domain-containing protein [Hymenobacter metallilatus]
MFRFPLLTAAFVFTGLSAGAASGPVAPPDSIGVEYRGNKLLIKHRVTPGETLYGVARRYKVPVEDIVEANSGQKGALVTGQLILVPRNRVVLTQPAAPKATVAAPAATRSLPTDARGNRVYKVEPGMTLFAIARRFQTTPAELARLNGFPANYNVRVGQLVVVAGSAAAPAPVARPTTPVATTRPAPTTRPERDEEAERDAREAREKEARERAARERARDSATSPAVTPPAPAPTTPAPAPEKEKAPSRASEIVRRVSESGLATAIQTDASDKYLALHKTAPVGTIMEVKNIMNGQSVYVRVIGQLPDTGENTNILVRLSKRAVQRLATPDQRFRVETNYVP